MTEICSPPSVNMNMPFPHIMMGGSCRKFAPPHRWGGARPKNDQNCGGETRESPPYIGGFLPPKFPPTFQKFWSYGGEAKWWFPPTWGGTRNYDLPSCAFRKTHFLNRSLSLLVSTVFIHDCMYCGKVLIPDRFKKYLMSM